MAWFAKFEDIEGSSSASERDGVPPTDVVDLTYEPERDDGDAELPPPHEPSAGSAEPSRLSLAGEETPVAIEEFSFGFTPIKDSDFDSSKSFDFVMDENRSADGLPRMDIDDFAFEIGRDAVGEPDPLPPFEPDDPMPRSDGDYNNDLDIILWDVVGA